MDLAGLAEQAEIFGNARVIIGALSLIFYSKDVSQIALFRRYRIFMGSLGGHGAGMTNMLFVPPSSSIIELPLRPHVDRCYGFVALALGLDYWLLPEVHSAYHLNYTMTAENAHTIVSLVLQLISSKVGKIDMVIDSDKILIYEN